MAKDAALEADRSSALWKALKALTRDLGVQRNDLYTAVSVELCQLWDIDLKRDSPEAVKAKVIWQVKWLFSKMSLTSEVKVAWVCFNLPNGDGGFIDQHLTARQEYLGTLRGLGGQDPDKGPSKSTIQRYLRGVLDTFWIELHRAPPPPVPPEVIADFQSVSTENIPQKAEPATLVSSQPYIDRPDYRTRFESLLAANKKLIVFVGLPGIGKTWLARAVTRGDDGTEAPRIRIVGGAISTPDLKRALQRCGVEVSNIVGHEREHLVTLVCGSHAPKFVVLDGFESIDEISSLMPGDTDSVVVATCRRKSGSSIATDAVIPVREMSGDEPWAMVTSLLADVDPAAPNMSELTNSLARIMFVLSGHPLGISRAFELVRDHKLSISKLCDELESDPLAFMRRLRTGKGSSFVADIEHTLALVQEQDEIAYRLLEAVSFLYLEDPRDSSFLQKYLEVTHRVSMSDRSSIGELRFRQAIELLLNCMLIELHEKDLPQDVSDRPYTHVYVHPLVIKILRHRFERRAAEVAEGFIKVCNSYNKQYDNFEALQGILQTVTLLGRILIDDDPPGAASSLQPWNRHTVPRWLSAHIIYLERILGDHFDNIFSTPMHWKEWARSRAPRWPDEN